ncbi:MAG: ABC transporter ATP-binding protein [Phycisphaerae bacterium]|nr:ABC transporter ATP-binding protein [Saprospiraceae bacterium]
MPIIQTRELSFHYGKRPVLQNISLQVPDQSIYGFLGPNGAGKTTTIRILLNLIRVAPQSVRLFGLDLSQRRVEILRRVGSLIEMPSLYRHLTGRENLEVIRRLTGAHRNRIDEVLKIVRLPGDAHRKVKEYSLGMGQRLGLAMALLTDPQLLILDEPTNGLDPSGIIEIRELIVLLNQEHGKTIFLSSHLLNEIERIATCVGVIDRGKLLFQGALSALQRQNAHHLRVETDAPEAARQLLRQRNYTISRQEGRFLEVPIADPQEAATINRYLIEQGINVFSLRSDEQQLEDIFLRLTGHQPN